MKQDKDILEARVSKCILEYYVDSLEYFNNVTGV